MTAPNPEKGKTALVLAVGGIMGAAYEIGKEGIQRSLRFQFRRRIDAVPAPHT